MSDPSRPVGGRGGTFPLECEVPMTVPSVVRRGLVRPGGSLAGTLLAAITLAVAFPGAPAAAQQAAAQQAAPAFTWNEADPRIGLAAGWHDAASAIRNLALVGSLPRPAGFHDPADPGAFAFANTDLAFQGDLVFVGNYSGFQAFDVSDPRNPRLRVAVVCPGGQGDVSVHGNLLFMSVEETRGRLDCGTEGVQEPVSGERFRGVRIFDISDLDTPRQVATVQTCRGSHTHTLVTSPRDREHVWIYVSGTGGVRPGEELAGCAATNPDEDPNTSLFRIEVIRVPLSAPQEARVVAEPRVFADARTGAVAGLWRGGDHGEGTQRTAQTNHCHDITVYPALGLAAGACSGNGILLDISDPENPVRIDEVADPNFAYWHSATFSNDGSKVIFTDEWGGGTAPRCRATDPPTWGANAIFHLRDRKLALAGYYKLPVPQTSTENCVAHNGSLIPVPGRDIKVQAWYQGGLSIFDFTDAANPVEIAFFDRGPLSEERLHLGGYWSTYWYDGRIYGAEIARGLDIFELLPSEFLSENEIEAARLVRTGEANAQAQTELTWPAAYPVARAYLDQLTRSGALPQGRLIALRQTLGQAEGARGGAVAGARGDLARAATELEGEAASARGPDALRLRELARVMRELAG